MPRSATISGVIVVVRCNESAISQRDALNLCGCKITPETMSNLIFSRSDVSSQFITGNLFHISALQPSEELKWQNYCLIYLFLIERIICLGPLS